MSTPYYLAAGLAAVLCGLNAILGAYLWSAFMIVVVLLCVYHIQKLEDNKTHRHIIKTRFPTPDTYQLYCTSCPWKSHAESKRFWR